MAKKDQPPDLPEVIYVKWETDPNDPDHPYLVASESPSAHAEPEETVRVGVYALARHADVVNRTDVKEIPNK